LDNMLASAASAYIVPQIMAHLGALKVPVVEEVADKWLIRRIKQLLDDYGHPEYITDVTQYADGTAMRPVFNRGQQRRRPAPAECWPAWINSASALHWLRAILCSWLASWLSTAKR